MLYIATIWPFTKSGLHLFIAGQGDSALGTGRDEAIHCIIDLMQARAPYTTLQRAMLPTLANEARAKLRQREAAMFHLLPTRSQTIENRCSIMGYATRSMSILRLMLMLLLVGAITPHFSGVAASPVWTEFPLPRGSGPHDVAPGSDGTVWFTAQAAGKLGRLDPQSGRVDEFPLGRGSAPHGVIIGPDGAPWVTDGGLNAILRFDPGTHAIRSFPLPASQPNANLNTATFDRAGTLWFTGQNGVYGRVEPRSGEVRVWAAPRGPGPYGITTTGSGVVYFASLAGSYIARIDSPSGAVTVIEPPTPHQGARRIWSDSKGALWISEFRAGQIAHFQPEKNAWQSWPLPGAHPQPYAIYVDEHDTVWVSDFGAGTLLRFDPASARFDRVADQAGQLWIRQLLGRPGEVWGADSAHDRLIRIAEPK